MPRKRRSYPAELKAKVALEAIYKPGLHRRAQGRWDPHLDGRQGPLDG